MLESSGESFKKELRDPHGAGLYGISIGASPRDKDLVRIGTAQAVLLARAFKARVDLHKPVLWLAVCDDSIADQLGAHSLTEAHRLTGPQNHRISDPVIL